MFVTSYVHGHACIKIHGHRAMHQVYEYLVKEFMTTVQHTIWYFSSTIAMHEHIY
jgi:hypothetical protein